MRSRRGGYTMNNLGTLYRFEMRKILRRRITVVVLAVVTLSMIAMNIGEYIAGGRAANTEEKALVGRTVDETLLSEMREAIEPKRATMEDGETVSIGISVKDKTYAPLMDYLFMLGGNYDKAYNMTEEKLYSTFDGVIDTALEEQHLHERELQYWAAKRAERPEKLTYDEIQNGWGDSVTIIYVVSLLTLIAVAATLSGVFSEESSLKTDALIFSSRNGRKRLMAVKFLAGITVGLLETAVLLITCIGTEFAISGFGGRHGSVQFFVGPTAMDMEIGKAFLWYVGIMLVIGLLFSVMAMFLSELFHNSIAVVAIMMFLWLLSMLNIPYSMSFLSRIWSYFPVTFLGSWTFTDYRLVYLFGKPLTIIEAAPIIYVSLAAIMVAVTKWSYDRYQVQGR